MRVCGRRMHVCHICARMVLCCVELNWTASKRALAVLVVREDHLSKTDKVSRTIDKGLFVVYELQ